MVEITIYEAVIISIEPDAILVKCGRCKGTGTRDRDGRDPICGVCGGNGKVFLRVPADKSSLIKCGFCKGDGARDRDGRDPVCPVCKGVGAVFARLPAILCNRCNGTGSRDRDGRTPLCSVCDGVGVVPVDSIKTY